MISFYICLRLQRYGYFHIRVYSGVTRGYSFEANMRNVAFCITKVTLLFGVTMKNGESAKAMKQVIAHPPHRKILTKSYHPIKQMIIRGGLFLVIVPDVTPVAATTYEHVIFVNDLAVKAEGVGQQGLLSTHLQCHQRWLNICLLHIL